MRHATSWKRNRTAWVLGVIAVTAGLSLAWKAAPVPAPQQQPGMQTAPTVAQGSREWLTATLENREWRELNIHDHGIGLRVESASGFFDWPDTRRVLVLDLGPDVINMHDDIPPEAGFIMVNGQGPLPFDSVSGGVLQALVPSAWLSTWGGNQIVLKVWGPQGQLIVDLDALIPGLL